MSEPLDPERATLELELPPRAEVVSVARLVIGAIAAEDPLFDEERSADLRLAVSEACTNAIQAQMKVPGERGETPIVMRCEVHDGRIEVSITDHGPGFEPGDLDAHPPPTDPARLDYEGGLGIPLLRLLTDELDFRVSPTGTTVHMSFEPRGPSKRTVHDLPAGDIGAPG